MGVTRRDEDERAKVFTREGCKEKKTRGDNGRQLERREREHKKRVREEEESPSANLLVVSDQAPCLVWFWACLILLHRLVPFSQEEGRSSKDRVSRRPEKKGESEMVWALKRRREKRERKVTHVEPPLPSAPGRIRNRKEDVSLKKR